MNEPEKQVRFKEIKELIQGFCDEHLNQELTGYSLNLFEKLSREKNLSMIRGEKGNLGRIHCIYHSPSQLFI